LAIPLQYRCGAFPVRHTVQLGYGDDYFGCPGPSCNNGDGSLFLIRDVKFYDDQGAPLTDAQLVPLPEPGGAAMVLLGVFAIAGYLLKRRRAA